MTTVQKKAWKKQRSKIEIAYSTVLEGRVYTGAAGVVIW
jgi:hypothetical protein